MSNNAQRNQRKNSRSTKRNSQTAEDRSPEFKMISPKNAKQTNYFNAIKSGSVIVSTGCAGTGKTAIATFLAAEALFHKRTEKIYLTRPAVEAGEELGFLPGEIADKFAPYLAPFKDHLIKALGCSFFEYLLKQGKIEALPLAYTRGKTFEDCWVLLDEAQNTTPNQMKMFLTRFGPNCKMIINGDTTQQDIDGLNGLEDLSDKIKAGKLRSIQHVHFEIDDVVRHGFVKEVLRAY